MLISVCLISVVHENKNYFYICMRSINYFIMLFFFEYTHTRDWNKKKKNVLDYIKFYLIDCIDSVFSHTILFLSIIRLPSTSTSK